MPIPDPLSGDVRGLRLALSPDLGFYAIDAAVEANLRTAAAALEDAGASVEEVRMDWTVDTVTAWSDIWNVYLAAAGAHILDEYRNRMDPVLVALMDAGHVMSAVDYRRLEEVRTRQWKSLAVLFADYDALLCPTMALPAPSADALDDEFETIDAEGRLHGLDMTSVFNNVAQCPALSVPSGFSADGLPTAVQIVGRRFDDPTVLKIGAALETALPWAGKLQDLGISFR